MNIKALIFLITGCLVALAAWLVHMPNPTQADEVPEKYRDTVSRGLEFLVKQQHQDGHWEGDGGKHPVAVTALAGMALLMEGSNVKRGKYAANLRKAGDWLMDQCRAGRDGLIYSGHPSETGRYMQGHGLATQFLAWACHHEDDEARQKRVVGVLTSAVKYIVKAQSTRGGWYDTSRVEGHDFDSVAATAIQVRALFTAGELGSFQFWADSVVGDTQAYLKAALLKYEKVGKAAPDRRRTAETVAALACCCMPDGFHDSSGLSTAWVKYCRTAVPMGRDLRFGRDELTHYYYAQAVYTLMLNTDSGARKEAIAWSDYRASVFDHLQSTQDKNGSWPMPTDSEGSISVGPVYGTAVWSTILQLDKKRHPLTRERILRTF